jgi:predicted O-methyltransferase YrrM
MRDTEVAARDQYIEGLYGAENSFKAMSREAATELGLARISLSAGEGRLVSFFLRALKVKKCVEIGTLTGLSAQYILDALTAGGELWTFEKSPEHIEKAEKVFADLKPSSKIHLVAGDAQEKLLEIENVGPFDAIFIDGNKAAYGNYLAWAEKNLRRGGLILADNVFLSGAVWGDTSTGRFSDKQIKVMREFNQRLADESLYDSALVPTHEGLFCAIKKF